MVIVYFSVSLSSPSPCRAGTTSVLFTLVFPAPGRHVVSVQSIFAEGMTVTWYYRTLDFTKYLPKALTPAGPPHV